MRPPRDCGKRSSGLKIVFPAERSVIGTRRKRYPLEQFHARERRQSKEMHKKEVFIIIIIHDNHSD